MRATGLKRVCYGSETVGAHLGVFASIPRPGRGFCGVGFLAFTRLSLHSSTPPLVRAERQPRCNTIETPESELLLRPFQNFIEER
jgi:hypothetical protein